MSEALIKAAATVRLGVLDFDDGVRWRRLVRDLQERLRVLVRVERLTSPRTSAQNRYYWGAIVPAVCGHLSRDRDLPLHPEQVHFLLKSAFLGVEETPLGPVPKRSRDLTTDQFTNFCEEIRAHAAAEWGFSIPGPEDGS